ncbi:hypothetical protein AB0C29_24795 [Actinoplanes sp. NPDC048791]|uniref:hypothetical protein n=1 Tax=Actinoplanes sp. NPDC048791 TaxID=3154623 RepID=UPI0033C58390
MAGRGLGLGGLVKDLGRAGHGGHASAARITVDYVRAGLMADFRLADGAARIMIADV